MTNKFPAIFILSLAFIVFTACKKDNKTTSNEGGGGTITPPLIEKFEGKVSGVMKTANSVTGSYSNGSSHINFEAAGNGQWGMFLSHDVVAGQTYTFGSGQVLIGYSYTGSESDGYISTDGTATVIRHDTVKRIVEVQFSGLFEDFATGTTTITVTNGHMIADY